MKEINYSPYRNLIQMMPTTIKNRVAIAVAALSLIGILEAFSLGSLMAFFTVSSSEISYGQTVSIFGINLSDIIPSSPIFLLILALTFFVLKALATLFVNRYSFSTAVKAKKYFQELLFESFLSSSLIIATKSSASIWVRNVMIDCASLEGRFLMPVLVLLGEFIPSISICLVLLYINWSAFVTALAVFLVLGIFTYKATNMKLVNLGIKQQQADGEIVLKTQQAFMAYKEISVYDIQKIALNDFKLASESSAVAIEKSLFLGLLPRTVFEIGVYLLLGFLFTSYLYQDKNMSTILGETAVFGAATMRLLPSVSKILSHLQSLKHARPAIEAILVSIEKRQYKSPSPVAVSNQWDFKNLEFKSVNFNWTSLSSIKNISFQVKNGDRMAIIGISGAGKSTVLNLILGLLEPHRGDILVNSVSMISHLDTWRSNIGFVPQDSMIFEDTIAYNITLDRNLTEVAIKNVENLLDELNLSDLGGPNMMLTQNGGNISGGQKQRIAIARALFRKPKLLILDEATSAMDEVTQEQVYKFIDREMSNKTIIMVTHRMELMAICNKKLILPDSIVSEA